MDHSKRWEIIGELGEGGQGKVYRVLDKEAFHTMENLREMLRTSVRSLSEGERYETKHETFQLFSTVILDLVNMQDPSYHGALKVLHEPKEARDPKLAETRIKTEIKAMSETTNPNLIKILDTDPDSKWFVSQFHPKGSLNKYPDLFAGNFVDALRAFRPLVAGVSELHQKGVVHRDIKPQNVFLDSNNNLVLGDFGLVFFTDKLHTRISGTFENVGSRDWMPAWAQGMRVEDVKTSFDVFSLGKLLWSMVSGLPPLRLWYYNSPSYPDYNVENIFPNAHSIKLANALFKKCIVEFEKDCLPHAHALLSEIDQTLSIIENNADLLDPKIERRCKVCGIGNYQLEIDNTDQAGMQNFGLRSPYYTMKIFLCKHCGNVQLFAFRERKGLPPAWDRSIDLRGKRG